MGLTSTELIFSNLTPLMSAAYALVVEIYGKPRIREKEFERQRPDLLERLEYNLASDVASVIPSRSDDITDREYLETCTARLRDRVPRGIGSASLDYSESEHCFKSFVSRVRLFTHGAGAVIFLELSLFFLGCIPGFVSRYWRLVIAMALGGIVVLLLLMTIVTVTGDQYQDYLNRYKIRDTDSTNGKK